MWGWERAAEEKERELEALKLANEEEYRCKKMELMRSRMTGGVGADRMAPPSTVISEPVSLPFTCFSLSQVRALALGLPVALAYLRLVLVGRSIGLKWPPGAVLISLV